MTTAYTSLLGLALPVTGELSGTWGDTVNNGITSLLDSAIAGTTTLSTDADVTLTTTTGAANTSREAILLCSGSRTALRTITAPAQSKIYTVINATTGGFSVKVVGVGPTTGVTIVAGTSAQIAWNGSDFVLVSTLTSAGILPTANGGTGLTSFTSGGVVYASSTSALATGSALTFDGTNLGIGTSSPIAKLDVGGALTDTVPATYGGTIRVNSATQTTVQAVGGIEFPVAGDGYGYKLQQISNSGANLVFASRAASATWTERMRLDPSGNLGLGVTPPTQNGGTGIWYTKGATISDGSSFYPGIRNAYYNTGWKYTTTGYAQSYIQDDLGKHIWYNAPSGTAGNAISFTQAMTLAASGGLSVGTTTDAGTGNIALPAGGQLRYSSTAYITPEDNVSGARISAPGVITFWTGSTPSERMRIDSSGNVGIGIISPAEKLSVAGAIRVHTASSAGFTADAKGGLFDFVPASNNVRVGYVPGTSGVNTGILSFVVGSGSEAARIDSSGNLLVGGTQPARAVIDIQNNSGGSVVDTTLHLGFSTVNFYGSRIVNSNNSSATAAGLFKIQQGTTTAWRDDLVIDNTGNLLVGATSQANGCKVSLQYGGAVSWGLGPSSGSNTFYVTNNSGTGVYLSTGATSWAAVSDERTKDIIEPIENAAAKVATLRAVIGKYKTDIDGVRRSFLIAQDVQAVLPEAVCVQDDELQTLGVQYTDTIPLLVAAIQEQQAIIESLKARLDAANL